MTCNYYHYHTQLISPKVLMCASISLPINQHIKNALVFCVLIPFPMAAEIGRASSLLWEKGRNKYISGAAWNWLVCSFA